MELIVPLSSPFTNKVALAGGKASSLHKMLASGLNVPPGFVITTDAFKNTTPEFEAEVFKAFDDLGTELVAVRSSAAFEDSAEASWAGQLDTVLGVKRDNLLDAVKTCWASLESNRAKAYAHTHASEAKLAVIVQQMIESDIAGVAFSVHPITKDTNSIVVEAVLGIGEALVGGEVTPDTYIIEKNTLKTVTTDISEQDKQQTLDGWQSCGPKGKKQKLSNELIEDLARTVRDIEKFYGFPVDVEWTTKSGKLYIMQSRAITTLN